MNTMPASGHRTRGFLKNGKENPMTFIPVAENPGRIYLPDGGRGVGVPALIHDTNEKFYRWDENVSVVDGPRDSEVSCRNLNAPE